MDERDLVPQEANAPILQIDLSADQNPVLVYLASLASPRSRRVMRSDLDTIARILTGDKYDAVEMGDGWAMLRKRHTMAIRAQLIERYSPATVNRMLSAMRGVLKAAWELDLVSGEDYHKARSVTNVRGETLPSGRDLDEDELAALFRACTDDPAPAGVRDAAIFAVANSNPRRSEIAALDVSDYDTQSGRLHIRKGKGRKARYVYLDAGARAAMERWLRLRGSSAGALFCPINKGGNLVLRRMTDQAIYNMMRKRGGQAGVENFTPHDFRRTYAGDLLDAGADIATVQKLMGHADPGTTARYDRRPEETKREAANLRRTPFDPEK